MICCRYDTFFTMKNRIFTCALYASNDEHVHIVVPDESIYIYVCMYVYIYVRVYVGMHLRSCMCAYSTHMHAYAQERHKTNLHISYDVCMYTCTQQTVNIHIYILNGNFKEIWHFHKYVHAYTHT